MSDEIESDFESYFKKSNHGISSNGEPLITSQSVKDSWFGGAPWTMHVHVLVASLHTDFSWLFKLCSVSYVWLFVIPWIAARQASLSCTISWNLLKLTSTELVMSSSHLILCHRLLLLPSVFPSIRVFSSELTLLIRWPKYWSFSFSMSPFNTYSGLISLRIDWLDLLAIQGTLKSLLQYYSSLADIM